MRLVEIPDDGIVSEYIWAGDNVVGIRRMDLSYLPTIEAEPVRHGRWIWKGDDKGWFCSECGGGCLLDTESDWFKSNGCPHCRAKMDGDET